jgi:hypothetical protein
MLTNKSGAWEKDEVEFKFANGKVIKCSKACLKQIPTLEGNMINLKDDSEMFEKMLDFVGGVATVPQNDYARTVPLLRLIKVAAKYKYDALIKEALPNLSACVFKDCDAVDWVSIRAQIEHTDEVAKVDDMISSSFQAGMNLNKCSIEGIKQCIKFMSAYGKDSFTSVCRWLHEHRQQYKIDTVQELLGMIPYKFVKKNSEFNHYYFAHHNAVMQIMMNSLINQQRDKHVPENRVRRCESLEGGWRSGLTNALDFVVSKDTKLTGVGVCMCPGVNKISIQLFDGEQMVNERHVKMTYKEDVTKIDIEASLVAGKRYTIKVLVHGGNNSLSCKNCKSTAALPNGGTISFETSKADENGNKVSCEGAGGQIPDIYFD